MGVSKQQGTSGLTSHKNRDVDVDSSPSSAPHQLWEISQVSESLLPHLKNQANFFCLPHRDFFRLFCFHYNITFQQLQVYKKKKIQQKVHFTTPPRSVSISLNILYSVLCLVQQRSQYGYIINNWSPQLILGFMLCALLHVLCIWTNGWHASTMTISLIIVSLPKNLLCFSSSSLAPNPHDH